MSKQNNGSETVTAVPNSEQQNNNSNGNLEKLLYYCASDKNSKTYKKYKRKLHKHKKHISKKQKTKRILITALCIFLGIVLAAAGSFFVLNKLGKNKLLNYNNVSISAVDGATVDYDKTEIEYNNKKYVLNDNIISILCMGIDKTIEKSNTYGENGQADAIFVLTIDVANGNVNIIPINRDTMVDINTYSQNGTFAGVEKSQICLAYSYGNGKDKSCKNVADSVSRLLYGVPVKSYFAVDLDSVEIINDLCGGVTVVPNETFSYFGTSLTKGVSTTLTNPQAKAFVRYRNQSKLNSNVLRMQRQKEFLSSALKKLSTRVKSDISAVKKVYNGLKPYSYTNIDVSQTVFLASKVALNNKNLKVNYRSIKGKTVKGKYAEFNPNEQDLFELVLDIYYKEKN